jgi:putative spermidine/putrescine transport system permease protein
MASFIPERGGPARARALAALAPALLVVVVLWGAGMVGAVRSSLGVSRRSGWSAADLDAYRSLVDDPAFWEALWFTLRIAALATAASAMLALALAAVLRRSGALTRVLAAVPVPMPHLVAAVLGVLWLGPGGIADRILGGLPLDLVRDPAGLGVVLVYVYKETPFLALLIVAAWGPAVAAREEVAAVLGAGPLQRMRWVVWPAIRAPLVTGSAVVAAFVIGAFEVPLAIGPSSPRTLSELALDATRTASLEGRSVANAALLVASLLALVVAGVAATGLRRRHE